jgi:hypothetical protein
MSSDPATSEVGASRPKSLAGTILMSYLSIYFYCSTLGENASERYWLIGCFSGYSMETFQQVDGVYSAYPPADACNRLFPGLG